MTGESGASNMNGETKTDNIVTSAQERARINNISTEATQLPSASPSATARLPLLGSITNLNVWTMSSTFRQHFSCEIALALYDQSWILCQESAA